METIYQETITREEIETFPVFAFDGEIRVIENAGEVDEAVVYLSAHSCLGFDTETRPAFHKGETYPVSLLQLAAAERVYLFRLNKFGFTPSLRRLLADVRIKKIGVGIRDDLRMLKERESFTPASFVDLQDFVVKYGIKEKSFSKLMAIIFRVKISKRQRVTNWEALQLTPQQVKYAATDAWGALRMYDELLCHG
ncbi:3'-5' exonuclease [Culturomica massiliensis]|jgi:ribonuclease D|uniref:3'-5' exonuclease n=1 Tax=Culturomica massiliensis TaxID=1841857 RepID=UPI000E55ED8F|nr:MULTISPECIES: 3'-5' exonuclease [Odoribacteraceae]RHV94704.1 3'-5' exonuclease domain-containing protein 2 [Odoribacter sp. OF09-27XD]